MDPFNGKVCFITYGNSALSGLVQSQGIPQLIYLSEHFNYKCTLFTFEDPEVASLKDPGAQMLNSLLINKGIGWFRVPYRKKGLVFACAWDIVWGSLELARFIGREQCEILHARSYVAGFLAATVSRFKRKKYIFDPRDILHEIMVKDGYWTENSWRVKTSIALHRFLCRSASGIVSVSDSFRLRIIRYVRKSQRESVRKKVFVVANAVSMERFKPEIKDVNLLNKATLDIVYIGVYTQTHMPNLMAKFALSLYKMYPNVIWHNYVYEGVNRINDLFSSRGFPQSRLICRSLKPEEVAETLRQCDFGVAFFDSILLWDACPIKVGEYLAAGLPVIVNKGIMLLENIITEHRCGVILEGESEHSLEKCSLAVIEIYRDGYLATKGRCREAAYKYFSLSNACRNLDTMYQHALNTN